MGELPKFSYCDSASDAMRTQCDSVSDKGNMTSTHSLERQRTEIPSIRVSLSHISVTGKDSIMIALHHADTAYNGTVHSCDSAEAEIMLRWFTIACYLLLGLMLILLLMIALTPIGSVQPNPPRSQGILPMTIDLLQNLLNNTLCYLGRLV